ncbi:MAG: hypothetical protein Q4G09_00870 [Clostridia bacterium]|nr:hypothetical protein [Clostridia bacterium]
MENLNEILRSKEEKRILTGRITGIEDEYYKLQNRVIPCAIVWYNKIKILIPISHLNLKKENKSLIRGMLNAEIDFIVIETDSVSNIAIASRTLAMELRSQLELPKMKENDTIKVRIVATARKYIIVDCYGKEVIISVENLKHTFIVNAKECYSVGDSLIVRVKKIDIEQNIIELSAKDLIENPYKKIREYITKNGEYTGVVIGYPREKSGIIVQIDNVEVTCLARVPANFNNIPHLFDKVLVRITEIQEKKKLIYGILKRIIV